MLTRLKAIWRRWRDTRHVRYVAGWNARQIRYDIENGRHRLRQERGWRRVIEKGGNSK